MRFKSQQKLVLGLLALSLGALTSTLPASVARAASRPNIIVIQADDQTASQFTPDVMPRTYKLLHEPLVIKVPRRYRDSARPVRSSGEPVANIDLAPTILDLVHGTPCPPSGTCRTLDGRSLMPVLDRSGRWPHDRALLTEYRNESPGRYATCDFDGIRTKHGIYVEHYRVVNPTTRQCQGQLEVERYDFKDDPHELKNLCYGGLVARCPASQVQVNLARRLQSLRRCAGIAGRDERVDGRPYCK